MDDKDTPAHNLNFRKIPWITFVRITKPPYPCNLHKYENKGVSVKSLKHILIFVRWSTFIAKSRSVWFGDCASPFKICWKKCTRFSSALFISTWYLRSKSLKGFQIKMHHIEATNKIWKNASSNAIWTFWNIFWRD